MQETSTSPNPSNFTRRSFVALAALAAASAAGGSLMTSCSLEDTAATVSSTLADVGNGVRSLWFVTTEAADSNGASLLVFEEDGTLTRYASAKEYTPPFNSIAERTDDELIEIYQAAASAQDLAAGNAIESDNTEGAEFEVSIFGTDATVEGDAAAITWRGGSTNQGDHRLYLDKIVDPVSINGATYSGFGNTKCQLLTRSIVENADLIDAYTFGCTTVTS